MTADLPSAMTTDAFLRWLDEAPADDLEAFGASRCPELHTCQRRPRSLAAQRFAVAYSYSALVPPRTWADD